MEERVAVLGGGHGLDAVLRALRDADVRLTVIVTVADDGGSSGELRRRLEGPAVGDLRRSLTALSCEETALGRAFARPLTIHRLGKHPIGNLVIRSLAEAFGDLERASEWLGDQLSIRGRVLPATAESVSLLGELDGRVVVGESAISSMPTPIRRLSFDPRRPKVPEAVLEAIANATWVLLGPGSLYTSVLAASALPDVASALAYTDARVLWICNLESQPGETTGMTGDDHLVALRDHAVRIDAALYDPEASLKLTEDRLVRDGVQPLGRRLRSREPGLHDPILLGHALRELFGDATRRA
jgi:uncharacterized cofD-like protein